VLSCARSVTFGLVSAQAQIRREATEYNSDSSFQRLEVQSQIGNKTLNPRQGSMSPQQALPVAQPQRGYKGMDKRDENLLMSRRKRLPTAAGEPPSPPGPSAFGRGGPLSPTNKPRLRVPPSLGLFSNGGLCYPITDRRTLIQTSRASPGSDTS